MTLPVPIALGSAAVGVIADGAATASGLGNGPLIGMATVLVGGIVSIVVAFISRGRILPTTPDTVSELASMKADLMAEIAKLRSEMDARTVTTDQRTVRTATQVEDDRIHVAERLEATQAAIYRKIDDNQTAMREEITKLAVAMTEIRDLCLKNR